MNPDPWAITALGNTESPAAAPTLRRILGQAAAIADAIVAQKAYRPEWREVYRKQILEILLGRVQDALRRIEAA